MLDGQSAQGGSSVALAAAATLLTPPSGAVSHGLAESNRPPIEESESFPWHDASLPIVDRMKLAEGKPIERRMMAAMAQLNCGSCGYLCKTYAEAIASGAKRTSLSAAPAEAKRPRLSGNSIKNERPSRTPMAMRSLANEGYDLTRSRNATTPCDYPMDSQSTA